MDYYMMIVDSYHGAVGNLKASINTHMKTVKSGIMYAIMVFTAFTSQILLAAVPAHAETQADLGDNITKMTNVTQQFVVPTFNTSLSIWMQSPLIFVTATVLTLMLIGAVAGIIKGRRRGRG